MKQIIIFLLVTLNSCTTIPEDKTLFLWLEKNTIKKKEWIKKQDSIYNKYKNRYFYDINLVKNSFKKHHITFNTSIEKKIGNHFFKINEKGINYSKNTISKKYILFKNIDELNFVPDFISTNHSDYLIIKGSKLFNDKIIVQVWDISSKKLIKEIETQDYPKVQATTKNLFFYSTNNKGKPILKRFNFLDKKTYKTGFKSIYSFRVINKNKILTSVRNKLYLSKDENNYTPSFLFTKKGKLKFIGFNNNTFFFYKNNKTETIFYEYKQSNNILKPIYNIEKEISLTKCVLNNNKIYFSFVKNGENNLSYLSTTTYLLHHILSNKLGSFKLINTDEDYLTVIYSSFKIPEIIYKLYNGNDLVQVSETKNHFTQNYSVKQKWVPYKKDSIPIIFYYKDSLYNNLSPLIMYSYGGFKRSILPKYSQYINSFIDNGGVYAIAGIRGGGEKGESWHTQAVKHKKKQSFYDFSACLDFVIQNKISNPKNIAIIGGSNGGLLINYSILNYSNKFNVAISMKGLSDMVNYPKYNNGKYWIKEYGNPKKRKMYNYLKSYSPLHNLNKIDNKELKVLVITGDKDDRVTPLHSYKFVYGLQSNNNKNIYLKIIKNVGHKLPKKKEYELQSEIYTFIFNNIGVKLSDKNKSS